MKDDEITLWEAAPKPKKDKQGAGAGAYMRPWAAGAALVPVGAVAHWLWGDAGTTTGLAAAAITAAGGATTWLSWRLTRARTWYTLVMATATSGGITAWLATATALGTGRPVLDGLIVCGSALAGLSNVHTWARHQKAPKGQESVFDKPLPSWDQVCETVGIRGATMRITKRSEHQVQGEIELSSGKTAEDLQAHRKGLASAYDVAPGAVRIAEDPSRARGATITIITRDIMGTLIPWPGLKDEQVGASIADAPLELGLYEDGEPFTDEVNNRHTLTVGMSGAGKSVYGKVKIVSIAARRDTFVCAIDLAKGRQTLGPVGRAIGWAAFDKKAARAMLAGLDAAITARANYLSENKLPGWTPDCGLTFLHILIEEAADLVDFDKIVELMRKARSTGMHFELSLQRATWSNLDTDTRANLGDGICFGVRDPEDADKVLPDYVTEAGGDPAQWRKYRPGAAYAAIEHAPQERHTMPVKMYGPPTTREEDENNDLAPAAESLGEQDAKLDAVTRRAFGQAYAAYLAARQDPAATDTPAEEEEATTATSTRRSRAARQEQPDMDTDDGDEPMFTTPDPDPDLPGDIDDPIEMDAGASLGGTPPPRSRESAEQARQRLDAQLQLWLDRGITEFRAPELRAALADAQGLVRGRGWVLKELRRLEGDGRIIHHDGGAYEIAAPDAELVPA